MIKAYAQSLAPADEKMVLASREWSTVQTEVQEKGRSQSTPLGMRRLLMQIQPLPRSLFNLTGAFLQAILPQTVELNMLWGLLLLNVQVGFPLRSSCTL